jgi:hypothetical protein
MTKGRRSDARLTLLVFMVVGLFRFRNHAHPGREWESKAPGRGVPHSDQGQLTKIKGEPNRVNHNTSAKTILVFLMMPSTVMAVREVTGPTVTLSWDPTSGANGYKIYYAPYPDAGYVDSIDVGNTTTVTFNVWEGAAFYVAVQAYNENETSDLSNIEAFVVVSDQPLPAPELDIRANGSGVETYASPNLPVSISVDLDPGGQASLRRDSWIVARTPNGWVSYVDGMGWVSGIQRYSDTVIDIPMSIEVMDSPLPPGDYVFQVALDDNDDGVMDGTWSASVAVKILE